MATPLRLGVVGANPSIGWASRTHVPGLLALPDYDLAAVCTTKRESAEAAAQKYEARKAYWDYRDLVSDPDIDVVDVCVRVPYHFEIVKAALAAGKHVYCEWPLAATTAQAEELATLASKAGVHAMVGLQARAAPSWIHLRELIADGWLGRIITATMTQYSGGLLQPRAPEATWRLDRANGAHTLSISAGHAIDAFTWALGQLSRVSAIVDTLAPDVPLQDGGSIRATAPDHVAVHGRFEDGGIATIDVSSVPWHPSGFRLEVYGTDGTIVGSASQAQATGIRLQRARKGEQRLTDVPIPADLRWVPPEVPDGTPFSVAQMFRRFADGIREGSHPAPTFDDAVRNHRFLDSIERASREGRSVPITAQ